MRLTNSKMHEYTDILSKYMECTGLFGYAVAKNYRTLTNALTDYFKLYDKMLEKYGTIVNIPNSNRPTYKLEKDSSAMKAFINELTPISMVVQNVDILQVPYSEDLKNFTGEQLLALDFMISSTDKVQTV